MHLEAVISLRLSSAPPIPTIHLLQPVLKRHAVPRQELGLRVRARLLPTVATARLLLMPLLRRPIILMALGRKPV